MNWPLFFVQYRTVLTIFTAFCLFHSFGTDEKFKRTVGKFLGPFFLEHFWRGTYCLLSWLLFYPLFLGQLLHVDTIFTLPLLHMPNTYQLLANLCHICGVALFYWAFLQFDFLSFLGIRQFVNGVRILFGRAPIPLAVAGVDHLEVRGIYRWIRHPMLTGGMLMGMPSVISCNGLMIFTLVFVYSMVGSILEEKSLIRAFGADYLEYKNQVGAFFPRVRQWIL
jgi:protein-S-isoprenylcysteine O-methyltransferase Ste14